MILNSLLDSLHQIVFINIGETSELFLRVSEVLTHNNTGARGDPTQLCLASLTNFSQLSKGPRVISVGFASHTVLKLPLISPPNPDLLQSGRNMR